MKLLGLAASHRPASLNRQLLHLAAAILQQQSQSPHIELLEYSEWETPFYDDTLREANQLPQQAVVLREKIMAVDGLMIACPEYNWSYPGALKNTMDWISCFRPLPTAGKAAYLMCATPSERGGVSGLSHLKTVLEGLGMYVHPMMFMMGRASQENLSHQAMIESGKYHQFEKQLQQFMSFLSKLG